LGARRPIRSGESSPAPIGIELRHLRYFLAVSEELHFGRAADRLHIAQPPVSQAVRRLEDELGVQLFERTSRAVALTEAGRVFAEQARSVIATFDLAVADARRAGGAGVPLRVGCIPRLPITQLLRFLDALTERDPSSPTEVLHLLTLPQVQQLRAGRLDVGIFDHAENHAEIEVEPLFAGEPLAAFVPPDHRLAGEHVLGPDELRDEVLVVFPRHVNAALHERLLQSITGAGYGFTHVLEAGGGDPRDVMLAVAEGRGVSLAPHSMSDVGEAGAIVVRRPLEPPVAAPETVVAWRANPPRRLAEILATVREIARELRRNGEVAGFERDRNPDDMDEAK
jgi:DNA-binding transcriptional LysR family regulator